jgi:glucose/arabinose dehydrogenase
MRGMNLPAKITRICATVATTLIASACGVSVNPTLGSVDASTTLPIERLKLPPGFSISVYARVPAARQMVLSPGGTLFVGNRDGNAAVYAVPDKNKDGTADDVIAVAKNLHSPNGVEFRDGSLYVGEVSRITRYDNIEQNLRTPPKPILVSDKYPTDEHHGWKYIRFSPDGWLYVPIGAPCNVCVSKDPRKAGMTRCKPDGPSQEIFARGIRNTVGFDWDPKTGDLWFTDNGRDWLGDESPPDELNHASKPGMNFGFPFCHGKGISDPEFGKQRPCSEFTPCEWDLGPHVAALGMRFYNGKQFPSDYSGDILVCRHGSWNRASKIGYDVVRVHMKEGHPVGMTPFISGWLDKNGNVWGRPVDVVIAPDGSILVSDDFSGTVYRVTYKAPKS